MVQNPWILPAFLWTSRVMLRCYLTFKKLGSRLTVLQNFAWAESFLQFRPGIVSDVNIRPMTFKNPPKFVILAIKFDFNNGGMMGPRVEPKFCLQHGCDLCS